MLKRFVAIFLMIAVLSGSFTRFIAVASFKINQDYIAAKLCINRDKPAMHCNGRCFLAKRIKQVQEKEQQQEKENKKSSIQDGFIAAANSLTIIRPVVTARYAADSAFDLPVHTTDLFQPPKV